MRRLFIGVIALGLVGYLGTSADAGVVSFNFDDGTGANALSDGDSSSAISKYMTSKYGSKVIVSDAQVQKDRSYQRYWSSKGNKTNYIWTRATDSIFGGGDFEIVFDEVGFNAFSLKGFVVDATYGADFKVSVYDSKYDNGTFGIFNWSHSAENPNPSALIYSRSWSNLSDLTNVSTGIVNLARDGALVVISDSGRYDVAIDNFAVNMVPLPAAAWLGLTMLGGLGLLRRVRRRRS